MENKWEVKEVGEESYAITDGKITIVTSDADNDQYLQAIADLFNSSGYRFHSENKLELDLHIEAEVAKMELIDVKAKCAELISIYEAPEGRSLAALQKAIYHLKKALSEVEGENEVKDA